VSLALPFFSGRGAPVYKTIFRANLNPGDDVQISASAVTSSRQIIRPPPAGWIQGGTKVKLIIASDLSGAPAGSQSNGATFHFVSIGIFAGTGPGNTIATPTDVTFGGLDAGGNVLDIRTQSIIESDEISFTFGPHDALVIIMDSNAQKLGFCCGSNQTDNCDGWMRNGTPVQHLLATATATGNPWNRIRDVIGVSSIRAK
jgi:hypothetical protein